MPRQIESSANYALGGLLQGMLSPSRVHSANTQVIASHDEPDCSPHPFDVMAIFALYGPVP